MCNVWLNRIDLYLYFIHLEYFRNHQLLNDLPYGIFFILITVSIAFLSSILSFHNSILWILFQTTLVTYTTACYINTYITIWTLNKSTIYI